MHLRETRLLPNPHVQVVSYIYCGVELPLYWLIVYREQEVTVTEGYTLHKMSHFLLLYLPLGRGCYHSAKFRVLLHIVTAPLLSHPWLVPHLRHTLSQRVLCKLIIMESKKSYLCQICGKNYSYSSGLSCHKSTDHPEYSSCNISCNLCVESSRRYVYCYTGISCVSHTCRFYSSNDLIKHYKDVHN